MSKSTTSIKLIEKENQLDEKERIILEITNEGMDYLNKWNSNLIGIISIIGPKDSDKSSFANLIVGDKAAFDISESTEGIYMWGQPIAHQENTDLLVLDTESLYKSTNANSSYDRNTFILSSLLSSIMIYNTQESISDCINKFTNLAKESISCLKKIEGKELTPTELPLIYFVFHNINVDSNTAISQFKILIKDNIIFQNYFKNYKVAVLNKIDISKNYGSNPTQKTKAIAGSSDENGEQDYKQKSKLIKVQIMNDLEPKKINNCNLNGKCLFGLLQSFVDSLNKGENIILFNQFNNVLSLCLSDVVDQINFTFNSDRLNEKLKKNMDFEDTFLDICKATFNDCIYELFEKFKSNPIVKISPSSSLFNGINLIFRKCLDLLCENIQSSVDKKTQIINDISKIDYSIPNKLDGHNIEQLLYKLSNFINEKILSPLYEENTQKIQNNNKIFQILKNKICETIEKISPLIQGQINKLIEDNKKIKTEFNNFKVNQQKLIQQKNDEINDLKLKTEKQDRLMKEKELENMTLINIEKEKYNQLEEKYNLEINEKNSHIRELTKNSNSLSQLTTTGGAAQDANNLEIMQLESLKNDYNDITNILVKYKMLVSKLINDKDFFFEDILIDKTIGDLRKKYPEIFGLLSEKESLENMKNYYDKQIEILRNENISLKEKNMNQTLEINESKEKLDEAYKTIDDKTTIIDSQTSMIKNKETLISGLENQNKEYDIRYKGKVREMQDNYTKEKEMREQEYIREKQAYIREIGSLYEVIDGIFSRQRNKFDAALLNLSQDSQEKIKSGALNYKFK
jgi:hypothetical protein